jgi:hypothetical protein
MAWLATLVFLVGAALLWRLAQRLRDRPQMAFRSAVGALALLR